MLSWTADVLIETYAAESAVRRAQAALDRGAPTAALQASAARVLVCDGAARVEAAARQALAAMAEGDKLRIALAALRRLVKADAGQQRRRCAAQSRRASSRRRLSVRLTPRTPALSPT